jgi:hypothetical protein
VEVISGSDVQVWRKKVDGWDDGDEKTREMHYGSSNRYYR